MKDFFYVIAVTCLIGTFAHATNSLEEEYGKVQTIYSNGDFEIRYLDAPRGSVVGRVYQFCDNKRPTQEMKKLRSTVQFSKKTGATVMVRHQETCVDSVLTIEEGAVSKVYSNGDFEIRYLDAPRGGSVSGRVLRICDDVKTSQPVEVIKQAVDWANLDKNLVVEARVHGEWTCIDSIKLKSK